MATKKLFIVQYSEELDEFQLLEVDDPQQIPNFEISIIDAPHQSNIRLSSHLIDTAKIQCSFPNAQLFANPHNQPVLTTSYGLLYNFYAASLTNFAPEGWRLPNYAYANTLMWAVGNGPTAGGRLKCTGFEWWSSLNINATDNYGFSAPGSGRRHSTGPIGFLQQYVYYWINEYMGEDSQGTFSFASNNAQFTRMSQDKESGFSVRFVKEDDQDPGFIYDYEGRKIPTIKIGNQVWTAINWKSAFLFDGTPIPFVESDEDWNALVSPAYCHPSCAPELI